MKTVERTQATATRHGGFEVATSVAVQPLQLWKVARFTPSSVLFLQESVLGFMALDLKDEVSTGHKHTAPHHIFGHATQSANTWSVA